MSKIPIRKTNRLVPRSKYPVICKEGHQWSRETTLYRWAAVVTDISRVRKRKNWEWVGVPTREPVRLESDNVTTNTFDMNLNTFNMLGTTKLGFLQNIKYHIIWWKK